MNNLPVEIDCRSVKQKLDAGEDFLLLDCRENEEHAAVCIPEAKLIPMGEITSRVGELEAYRNKPIVVHCHHGGRSLRVTNWLRQQGFANVQNMTGGIDEWAVSVDPSLPRY
jgi:adenylyltransferase/sulfurtransferase